MSPPPRSWWPPFSPPASACCSSAGTCSTGARRARALTAGRYRLVTARIAVIDDEAPNRAYLQLVLSGAGYAVEVAAGSNEGIALVESSRPELVILDLMMPEVDGFTACERIRKGPAGAETQIVILSALDDTAHKVRALEIGADDYLVKPVEARELLARIRVSLDRAERLRQQGSHARGRLAVVAGAKGGIGTSTVAMNLAALEA